MESQIINMGIGFVTGRPNVCNIINNYYKNILEQLEGFNKKVNLTIFVLYDLSYQKVKEEEFYKIKPEVSENIKIKYITPNDLENDKRELIEKYGFQEHEVNYILGHGHAKGRNTVMYYALKEKINYLLFWDDDEYPVACIKNENKEITWKSQKNVVKHLEAIQNAEISIGYHCGYVSPIPYVELDEEIEEKFFKKYIEAISNELVDWNSIKRIMVEDNGVTYADEYVADGNGLYEKDKENGRKWVAGSTLCINLDKIESIPAFYNPPGARGEDTFFSTMIDECKVMKIPVYHFHDGFLKFKKIMEGNYPKKLRKIEPKDENVGSRFLKASKGWLKYKPLLLYIQNKENYKNEIEKMKECLELSIPEVEKLFEDISFSSLLEILHQYDLNVEQHYKEYIETNRVWNKVKLLIK